MFKLSFDCRFDTLKDHPISSIRNKHTSAGAIKIQIFSQDYF
jgi:hypothetical protein